MTAKMESPPAPTRFGTLLIPCATVFISSFCIMVVELVAGRIIARFLGSSLYTWTSVIGVVLAGITIGNYVGGRVADRWPAQKALSFLFAIASGACVATVVLNNLVGPWAWLWQFTWPVRVFLHVTLVFLLPSLVLGTISPVVAKSALDRGLPTGRTVGDIYAWGAAGSIAGTFAAGYFLIATMGTIAIIWTVAGLMLAMALLYGFSYWQLRAAAVVFIGLVYLVSLPSAWANTLMTSARLKEAKQSSVIYEKETQYCHVKVVREEGQGGKLGFHQDKLIHSMIDPANPSQLGYMYENVMAAVTHRFANSRQDARFLVLGGGGYVLPRYLQDHWNKSFVDVVEIDPGVTKAAIEAFGLSPSERMTTFPLDARNYVDGLISRKSAGRDIPTYDFIYEDAVDYYSVPFQLTTREFQDKIRCILKEDGIYMIELMDIYDSGLFAGSLISTVKESFPYVYVISEQNNPTSQRTTFVLIASGKELTLSGLQQDFPGAESLWYLSDAEITTLQTKAGNLVLTDDFAPVENLIRPVVLANVLEASARRSVSRGNDLVGQIHDLAYKGQFAEVQKKLAELAGIDKEASLNSCGAAADAFWNNGRKAEAMKLYQAGLEMSRHIAVSRNVATFHYNHAIRAESVNDRELAKKMYALAEAAYKELVSRDAGYADGYAQLGNIYAQLGDFVSASNRFAEAVKLEPANLEYNMNLLQATEGAGLLDGALASARKTLNMYVSRNDMASAGKVQDYIRYLEAKKAGQSTPGVSPLAPVR